MADPTNFRTERIEKLLHELRYEIERGMLDGWQGNPTEWRRGEGIALSGAVTICLLLDQSDRRGKARSWRT